MRRVAIVCILSLSGVFHPGHLFSFWPTQQADYQRTGAGVDAGPLEEFIELWNFTVGSVDTAIVVDMDGVAYFNASSKLYAVSGGKEIWRFGSDDIRFSIPSLGYNAAVYAAARYKGNNYLIAIDRLSGKEMWRSPLGGRSNEEYISHVAVGKNGMIYASGGDIIAAFLPDGTKKWSYALNVQPGALNICLGAPGISPDETIIYAYDGCKGGLYAFNMDGTLKWHDKTPSVAHYSALSIGPDGTVYIPDAETSSIYAIGQDGKRRWRSEFKDVNIGDALIVINGDGTLYATVMEKEGKGGKEKVVSIDSQSGSVKWEFIARAEKICVSVSAAFAIDKMGRIYYVTTDGNLYVLNKEGMLLKKSFIGINITPIGDFRVQTFLAISDGVLYIAGMDKVLYAIGKPPKVNSAPF